MREEGRKGTVSYTHLDVYKRQTLDRVSEGIKETLNENRKPRNKKIEDRGKEIEITEYKRILLSENKNNSNKENNKYPERKTKKIRKICRKKIINTIEELEMMKNELINMFNIPITNHGEIINVKEYRRRSIKIVEITYYKTTDNNYKKIN